MRIESGEKTQQIDADQRADMSPGEGGGCGKVRGDVFPFIFSVTFADSPERWAFPPHFTDNEMESRSILPLNPELDTKARTRTLALLTPCLRLNRLGQLISFLSRALLTDFSVLKFWSREAVGNKGASSDSTGWDRGETGKAEMCSLPPCWVASPIRWNWPLTEECPHASLAHEDSWRQSLCFLQNL